MIIAIIPAKKDSNRMLNKNMRILLGKPLIEYAIDYARQSKRAVRIFVSTDCKEISDFAESHGVEVISRPQSLGGETPLIDVYKHTLETLGLKEVQTVAGVQADHPDRNVSLDEALDNYEKGELDNLYSKDAKGQKNGAHFIMSVKGIFNNTFEKRDFIIDDCTNIHFESDLLIAEERMKNRNFSGGAT